MSIIEVTKTDPEIPKVAIFIMRTLTKSKVRFTGFIVETKGFV